MIVAVVKETFPGERRVALVPTLVPALLKAGLEVRVETGAGQAAGFPDQQYADKGANIAAGRDDVLAADVILRVRAAGANRKADEDEPGRYRSGQVVIGMCDPLDQPAAIQPLAQAGITLFALELLPRITRAQSMDVLSSMATVSGYRAVLLAAQTLPRMFPMLMTAAGTVTPAKVFIVGAGVAGLQAIATAKRLGAVVSAYDVRPVVKEQCESVGAKFIELALDTAQAEGKGGYAQAMGEEFYARQREMMTRVVAEHDVVITTAVIPGKKAPVLITAEMVAGMAPGSVIIDLAAERGGNCELTRPDETVVHEGVTILGPTNLPAGAPYHASQMYAKNVTTFLLHLLADGRVKIDRQDEIVAETLLALGGRVVHPRICELLGVQPPVAAPEETTKGEVPANEANGSAAGDSDMYGIQSDKKQ
ncbi:MAG: Re/Si-specific NAD(P)(+) transhydrogenase subunit alpha [Pirellulales bacterium]|nr:Re/Si-specific NAD(P)(+) transhydrogenase subunit alpha [Pirellulales bacterium]